MTFPNRPVDAIEGWHAHIYYDPITTKDTAAKLRAHVEQAFPETIVGRWHDELVGPHLVSMYQIAFTPDQFALFVQWLAVNRDGLNVLVHPTTENSWNDHMIFGFWLGDKLPLNEQRLKEFAVRANRPT